jgi:predicted flap endonuclease-1-like 5' DNA nuclease
MWTVAQNNLVLLVIALVIGLAIALWLFRGRRPASSDGPEGNALPDEFAAATQDVAGEIFGVDAHPNIPGPSGPPDNLQLLKGVGPKLAAQLNEFGITRFDQLAGLTENEVALLDRRMGAFEGRIARDRLVEQACYLERGDTDGFEAKFGKLGG